MKTKAVGQRGVIPKGFQLDRSGCHTINHTSDHEWKEQWNPCKNRKKTNGK